MYFVFDLLGKLQDAIGDDVRAKQIRDELAQEIGKHIPELERSLNELHDIHNRILPTAGGIGLVEILSGRPTAPSLNVDASQHISVEGGGDYVGGNQQKAGRDLYDAEGDINVGATESPETLEDARSALMSAVENFPSDRRELVQNQIDELVDAITRKSTPSEIAKKAKALEMFLESGKELLTAPAKAGWSFIKGLIGSK